MVVFERDSTFVYVRTDTVPSPKFDRRAVDTGLSDGIIVEIRKGIKKSDVIRAEKL